MYEHICVICGKPFTSARPDSKCCSRECKYEKAKQYARAHKTEMKKTCPECGKTFVTTNPDRKYCSFECGRQHANNVKREKRYPKAKNMDIVEVVKKATEMGITYGEYVARWGS